MTTEARTTRNRQGPGGVAGSILRRYGVLVFLAALIVIFSLVLPQTFSTGPNARAILADQSIPVILALAAIFPLAAGEFDLSLGAVLGFSAISAITISNLGVPAVLVIIISILIGVAAGAINALFVVRVGVNAFIATLALATVLAGLNVLITKSSLLVLKDDFIGELTKTRLGGLQVVIAYALVVILIAYFVFEKTPIGRYVRATGMGRDAARLSGVRVNRYLSLSFMVAGGLAGFAGVLMASRGGTASPTLGPEFLLPAYAAAFLGATTVRPGYFNVWGTVFGVLLLAVGSNGLTLLGAQTWVTQVFNGLALLGAVSVSIVVGRRRRSST
ncbi:MAG TPA: ABC transporter permease [Pseudolysinimonas sp.]|nr:ABC transporter permease [Pseudolysinimonas sp.]